MTRSSVSFDSYYRQKQAMVGKKLRQTFPKKNSPKTQLLPAMQYSLLGGGKRIRPLLFLMTDDLLRQRFDKNHSEDAFSIAMALECIQTYSLIHDDLPAMDDDDLRRGQPSCHKKYNEATAILAGDALLIQAFELLSGLENMHAREIIRTLTQSCGVQGMAGGQQLDLDLQNKNISLKALEKLHFLKTGAFIQASVTVCLLMHGEVNLKAPLESYAKHLGIAFQVIDDILDVTKTTQQLGKNAQSDLKNKKSTYVSILGLEASKQYAAKLIDQAINPLERLKHKASSVKYLVALAKHILASTH